MKNIYTQNQQEASCCGKSLELNIESYLGTRNESTGFNWPIHLMSEPLNLKYMKTQKIQGRNGRKVNILGDGSTNFSTVPEIANQLTRTFSNVTSLTIIIITS